MFGRIGLYLIPILLPVALPWTAPASKAETVIYDAADFTASVRSEDIVPAIVKAQVLLDRANISSGEIDDKASPRFEEAIAAQRVTHREI